MLITCKQLAHIFKHIYFEDSEGSSKRIMQIRSYEDHIEFAILYDLFMFFSYTVTPGEMDDSHNYYHDLCFFLEEEYFQKVYLITKYFPKNSIKFSLDGEHIYVELIENEKSSNKLTNNVNKFTNNVNKFTNNVNKFTNDIQFEFLVENQPKEVVYPPILPYSYTCQILSDTLLKMIQLGTIVDENINLVYNGSHLIIKNENENIALSSEIGENENDTETEIILGPLQRDFVTKVLEKIMRGKICNLYMTKSLPFIIESGETRIYSIHL